MTDDERLAEIRQYLDAWHPDSGGPPEEYEDLRFLLDWLDQSNSCRDRRTATKTTGSDWEEDE